MFSVMRMQNKKIGVVAERAGLAFTAFLLGKHLVNGNIKGLGYDTLNLYVLPKLGEKSLNILVNWERHMCKYSSQVLSICLPLLQCIR